MQSPVLPGNTRLRDQIFGSDLESVVHLLFFDDRGILPRVSRCLPEMERQDPFPSIIPPEDEWPTTVTKKAHQKKGFAKVRRATLSPKD